jgi:hypothetical protein
VFCTVIDHSNSRTLRKEICWTLSNIAAGNLEQIQALFDANVLPRVIRLVRTARPPASAAAPVHTGDSLPNHSSRAGTDGDLDPVKDIADVQNTLVTAVAPLEKDLHCEASENESSESDACIDEGESDQNASVDGEPRTETVSAAIRKEAAWVVCNICAGGSGEQLSALLDLGGLSALCTVFTDQHDDVVDVAMESIENLLTSASLTPKLYDRAFYQLVTCRMQFAALQVRHSVDQNFTLKANHVRIRRIMETAESAIVLARF